MSAFAFEFHYNLYRGRHLLKGLSPKLLLLDLVPEIIARIIMIIILRLFYATDS